MRLSRIIAIGAVVFGALFWALDAVVDYLIFYQDNFVELLITEVPKHDLWTRSLMLLLCALLGGVLAGVVEARERDAARITHLNRVLKAIRDVNQLIVMERDRGPMLHRACEILTSTRGYQSAWIALVNEAGDLEELYDDGLGELREDFRERLMCDEPLPCIREAAERGGLGVVEDCGDHSGDCPRASMHKDRAAYVAPLEHAGECFGFIGVSLPADLAEDEEERALFKEVADDLGLALQTMAAVEKQQVAEAAHERSERRYETLVETMNDGIAVCDTDATLTYVNDAFARMLGYEPDQLIGRNVADLVPPDQRENMHSRLQRRLTAGSPGTYESVYLTRSGERLEVMISASPLLDESGEIVGGFAVVKDISKLKEREEQLEQLQNIVDRSPVVAITWAVGEGWPVDFVSESTRQFGYTPRQFMSGELDFVDVVHPDDVCRVGKEITRAVEDGRDSVSHEYRILTADGDVRWIDDRTTVVRDENGEVVRFDGILLDITERKLTEEALRDSEERYRLLAENTVDVIWTMAPDMTFTYVNAAIEELTGFTADEWVGTRLDEHTHSEELEQMKAQVESAVSAGPPGRPVAFQTTIVHRDGHEIPVEITGRAIFDDDGRVIELQGVTRDITDRKHAEKATERSARLMRELINATPDVALLLRPDGTVVVGNQENAERLGIAPDEITGTCVWDHLEPPVSSQRREMVEAAIATGEPVRWEDQRAGRWLDNCANPVIDADGEVVYIAVFTHDITALREAEIEREQYLRELVLVNDTVIRASRTDDLDDVCELVADIVQGVNEDSYVVVSLYDEERGEITVRAIAGLRATIQRAVDLLGFDPSRSGVRPEDMADEEALFVTGKLERIPGGLATFATGAAPEAVCRKIESIAGVGETYTVGFALGDQPRGGITIFLPEGREPKFRSAIETIASHVSVLIERRQAQEQLREHSEIVRQTHDLIMVTDLDGRILEINEAEKRLLGYDRDELIGKKIFELGKNPEDGATQEDILRETIERGWWRGEVVNIAADGREVILDCRTFVLDDADGEPDRLVGVSRDITDRRRAEEQLRKRTHALGERVKEMRCLYHVAQLSEDHDQPIEEVLQEIADMLPVSWQFPDITTGRVEFQGEVYHAGTAAGSPVATQTAPITVHGDRVGEVAVGYHAERPDEDEGPFFAEERALIDTIAGSIGEMVEHRRAERERGAIARFPDENPMPVLRVREDGVVDYANDAAASLLAKMDSGVGHPAPQEWSEELEMAQRFGTPRRLEVTPDHRTLTFTLAPITEQGYINLYGMDVTERREAQEALLESEQRFRRAIAEAPFPIILHAEGGEVITTNRVWQQITGYAPSDIPTIADWTELAYGERRESVKEVIDRLYELDRSVDEGEFEIQTADGEMRTWHFHSAPLGELPDGQRLVISMASDVTARKAAEEALAESEKRYRTVFENTGTATCLVAEDGTIVLANEGFAELAAAPRHEIEGELKYSDFVAPHEKERMRAHHENRRKPDGEAPTRYEFDFVDRGGEMHRVFLNIDVIPGTKTAVASLVDVTQLRETQEELEALTEELEERVRDRTAQLRATNEELEAFAYSVSHDLRAPLRSIDGFSQAVLEDYADELDETGRDHLQRVRNASQRMGDLIDDLLQLSRITRAEFNPQRVDMSAVARDIIENRRKAEPDRSVEVEIEPDMTVDGDPKLLKVALRNLLGNAWKFTAGSEQARIEFTSNVNDSGQTIYTVSDTGAGFDMAYAEKLFQPFQRLHRSDEFPGTGIGLATVRRVITLHGGEVWGEGKVGEGASFSFTLSTPSGGADNG